MRHVIRMSTALWIAFQVLIAVSSALLAVFLWERRFAAELPAECEALRESRLVLEAQQGSYEAGRQFIRKRPQQAFLCLGEVAVRQRHSFRDGPGGLRYLVLHERITFRNIALSHWLEQEVSLEVGDDVEQLAKAVSIFSSGVLSIDASPAKDYVDELVPIALGDETVAPLAPEGVGKA